MRTLAASDMDVICYAKRYASDESVSQKPTLVLPEAFLERLPARLPNTERPLAPLSAARRKQWAELARELARSSWTSLPVRTIRYLLRAAEGGTAARCGSCVLPWHSADHQHRIVRLEDAPPHTFLKLFPVARFRANLKR